MNIEQALQILGGDFAKCRANNRNRAFSEREKGGLSVSFHYTKEYGSNIWWTSEFFDAVDGYDYIIIALQNCGLLVLPRKVVMYDYWANLNVSSLKGGRKNIRIKSENGKMLLYNRDTQPTIDVTEHLRQCEVD